MILSMFKKAGSVLLSAIGFIVSQVVRLVAIPFEWTVALIRKEPRKYEDVLADVIRVGTFALISFVVGNMGLLIIAAVMVASLSVELFLNTACKAKSIMAFVFFSAAAGSPTVHATTVPTVTETQEQNYRAAVDAVDVSNEVLAAVTAAVKKQCNHEPLATEGGSDSMTNVTPVEAPAELPADVEEALAILLNPDAYKTVDAVVTLATLEQPEISITPEDRRTLRDVGTKAAEHARDLRERLAPGGKGIVYPEGKM